MKKILKGLAAVVLPIVLLLFALNLVLTRHLTGILNRTAIPRAEQRLGVPIHVGRADVHLFGRTINLADVRVASPEGFDEPDLLSLDAAHITMRLRPLLRGKIDVSDLVVEDARLILMRNQKKQVNVALLHRDGEHPTGRPEGSASETAEAETATRPEESGQGEEAEPVEAIIRQLACNLLVTYVDHGATEAPLRVAFAATLEGENLSSTAEPDAEWGRFRLSGHLEDDPQAFVTALEGRLAPWSNPDHLGFDLHGDVRSIKLAALGARERNWDLQCESADLAIQVVCRDRQFADTSKLSLTLTKPTLTGELARKARNIPIPEKLTISAPLQGTIDEPLVDFQTAILQTVLQNLSGSLGTMLESTTINGKKLDGDMGEAARALGNLLKNWK